MFRARVRQLMLLVDGVANSRLVLFDSSRLLKKGASHPISREIATDNHELTGAKLVSVPGFSAAC